jgi:hypothetical protein
MRTGPNLWFHMEIDSGNAAVVDDPEGTILHCLEQVRARPFVMDGSRHKLRDVNGNAIGRFWVEFLPKDEDDDCN